MQSGQLISGLPASQAMVNKQYISQPAFISILWKHVSYKSEKSDDVPVKWMRLQDGGGGGGMKFNHVPFLFCISQE
jgi:hypothetical protein